MQDKNLEDNDWVEVVVIISILNSNSWVKSSKAQGKLHLYSEMPVLVRVL